MKRRSFIKVFGATTGVVAGSALVFSATEVDIAEASMPWREAGTFDSDLRLWALSYAILAPNPHNLQPWMAQMVSNDQIKLFADPNKKLPHTDPFDRQITIGLGCFCELLALSTKQKAYDLDFNWHFDEGKNNIDEKAFVTVTFKKAKPPTDADNQLFAQVLKRRSTKEPFDVTKKVDDQTVNALLNNNTLAFATNDSKMVEELKALTWGAMEAELLTPRTMKESIDYTRIGNKAIVGQPDGIDLPGPGMRIMKMMGMFSEKNMLDPNSMAIQQTIAIFKDKFANTNAFAGIKSTGNSRLDQINAGRQYIRLNLRATQLGLVIHPVSQSLQEYPEVAEYYTKVHQLFKVDQDSGRIQMLVRLGYANPVGPSPRWPISEKMIKS